MTALYIKDFPDDLHRALKIRAAEEEKSLKAVIIELLRKGLQETQKIKKAERR